MYLGHICRSERGAGHSAQKATRRSRVSVMKVEHMLISFEMEVNIILDISSWLNKLINTNSFWRPEYATYGQQML